MFYIDSKLKTETEYGTYTLIKFHDDEISGEISVQGNYTQMDRYNTSNRIVQAIQAKHQIKTADLQYIDSNQSNLTVSQKLLTKMIAYDHDIINKEDLIKLLPPYVAGQSYPVGRILWQKYADGVGLFYVTRPIQNDSGITDLTKAQSNAYQLWGSDYEGLW